MKQVQDGSRDALALLFLKCARSVRNIAYRVLRDELEADDLVRRPFFFCFARPTYSTRSRKERDR